MLGLARHAQYAGWGTGPLKPKFAVNSRVDKTIYSNTAYSLLDVSWNLGPNESGTYVDLSNLDNATDYHDYKSLISFTFYMPSSEFTGTLTGGFSGGSWSFNSPFYTMQAGGNSCTRNVTAWFQNNVLRVGGGAINFGQSDASGYYYWPWTDIGTYTDYTDTWLTLVYASSDDSADFAGYDTSTNTRASPTTSGPIHQRLSLYKTNTGELIKSVDANSIAISNWVAVSDYTSQSSVGISTGDSEHFIAQSFGNGQTRLRWSNFWFTQGQMIDPGAIQMGTIESSLFSQEPSPALGNNVTAILCSGLHDFDYTDTGDGSYNSKYYHIKNTNPGRFVQPDDRITTPIYERASPDNAWTEAYSTTIIQKDES